MSKNNKIKIDIMKTLFAYSREVFKNSKNCSTSYNFLLVIESI